jgi:hypothetical protein
LAKQRYRHFIHGLQQLERLSPCEPRRVGIRQLVQVDAEEARHLVGALLLPAGQDVFLNVLLAHPTHGQMTRRGGARITHLPHCTTAAWYDMAGQLPTFTWRMRPSFVLL